MNPADELLDRLTLDPTAPDRVRRQFASWWDDQDERALRLLDHLALLAVREPVALELLLTVIDQHGIARPALRLFAADEDELADAEQATLMVVRTRIDEYAGLSRFTTWLHQVAAHDARALVRARERPSTAEAPEP